MPISHRFTFPAALLSFALAASAFGADKPAVKAAADTEELQTSMAALVPERIECKAKTTGKVKAKDGKWMDAELTGMDLSGIHYAAKDGADGLYTWFDIGQASAANELLKKAVDAKNVGHNLLAARVLANLKLGAPMAEFYLRQAAALDKSLGGPKMAEANMVLAIGDYNRNKPEWAWPRLTKAKEREAIRQLDESVEANAKKAGLHFIKDQNEFFIFYTDSGLGLAKVWAQKLTNSYLQLCRTFDLDPRHNVWQGKCAVVVCKDQASYTKWMGAVAPGHAMAAKSAGLCISNSAFAGSSLIQFFHNANDLAYCESTLTHELCHAFTAQFHGNRPLTSWANEGLAEYVCTKSAGNEQKIQASREKIRATHSLEDFFVAGNIQFAHYGAAYEIGRLLLLRVPKGYAQFVRSVTEGMDAEEALKLHCGLTYDQLTAIYAKSLGMNGLRSH